MAENSRALSELTLEKRSGNSEKFSVEKLVSGISRAGTPFMLANDISKSIISKLAENPPTENHIYPSIIKEYVTEELKQRNQNKIAEAYTGYSKNSVSSIKEESSRNTQNRQFQPKFFRSYWQMFQPGLK
jgi:transcriptional repressor NrdR